MTKDNNYIKVTSYEAHIGQVKKILLLYSGGLDTSVILKWIKEQYGAEVITLTLDMGQQNDNLDLIKKKALKFGASKAIVLDVKEEFANEYIAKAIKANASYQGDYHLSTPIGRALIAKKAVEIAKQEGIDAIAHGSTGKGNDQVRIESYILVLDPDMKVIAPVREWVMDRNEEIKYAEKAGIPVPTTVDFPYSVDDNMWGMTWEGGEIEEPYMVAPIEKFLTTYTLVKNAPGKEEFIELAFSNGLPVALNGNKYSLSEIIIKLNKIAGKHGVGVVHLTEDRLIGVKNRGIYEQPAGHTIIEAHKALEHYVSTRHLNEIKEIMDIKWAYHCYGALWYDPAMDAINAFNDKINEKTEGKVTIKLFKGNIDIVAIESSYALDYASFNNNDGYDFNVNTSASFTEVHSLQMKLANKIKKKNKSIKGKA